MAVLTDSAVAALTASPQQSRPIRAGQGTLAKCRGVMLTSAYQLSPRLAFEQPARDPPLGASRTWEVWKGVEERDKREEKNAPRSPRSWHPRWHGQSRCHLPPPAVRNAHRVSSQCTKQWRERHVLSLEPLDFFEPPQLDAIAFRKLPAACEEATRTHDHGPVRLVLAH